MESQSSRQHSSSMKCTLVFVACVGAVLARPEPPSQQYGPPGGGYPRGGPGGGGGNGGGGGGDDNNAPANYNFAYEVKDAASGNDFGHMETRMGHVAMGTYYVMLPDGRMQKVDYVADQDGYRPTVTYMGEAMFGGGAGGGGGGGKAPGASYGAPASGGGGGGGYRYRR